MVAKNADENNHKSNRGLKKKKKSQFFKLALKSTSQLCNRDDTSLLNIGFNT